jgi:hypothetical protein
MGDRVNWVRGDDLDDAIRHLNDNHRAESLVMVRVLGELAGASAAWIGDIDSDGVGFLAEVGGGPVVVRLQWSRRAHDFRDVGTELSRLYARACRLTA